MHTKCPECNTEFTPEELNQAEISRKTAIESLHIYKAESEQRGFEIIALKDENARYIERIEELTSELSKLKAQADRHREALESDAEWDYTGWSEKFR